MFIAGHYNCVNGLDCLEANVLNAFKFKGKRN